MILSSMTSVCEYLLQQLDGRCLNDEDEECNTALHMASEYGKLEAVQKLINAGADKEARSAVALSNWVKLVFGYLQTKAWLLKRDLVLLWVGNN